VPVIAREVHSGVNFGYGMEWHEENAESLLF
jgi:hypothetical protein